MRLLALALGVSFGIGCSSPDPSFSPIYDPCFSVEDCVAAATLCEELAVEFAGFEYRNAICTTTCTAEGPLASDCARAVIGRQGSCYPSELAGGPDQTPICFEPCDVDEDCLPGFRCLGATELCGADPTCPIAPTDAICVPGP